jgi:hypothetical protein
MINESTKPAGGIAHEPLNNPHAAALGPLGQPEGRAPALSSRKRSRIAANAANARWGKKA